MRDPARTRYLLQEETVRQVVGTVPQSFATTNLDGRNRKMHLVDEIGVEELAHRGDATTDTHVFAVGRIERLRKCVLRRRIDEVERGVPLGY